MDITLVTSSFNDEVHGSSDEKKTGCGINLLRPENVTKYRRGSTMTDLKEITCEKCKEKLAKLIIKADKKEMSRILKEEKARAKRGLDEEGIVPLGNTTAKITKTPEQRRAEEERARQKAEEQARSAREAAEAKKAAAEEEARKAAEEAERLANLKTIPGTAVPMGNDLAAFAINVPKDEEPKPQQEDKQDDFLAQFAIQKPDADLDETPAAAAKPQDDFLAQFAIPAPEAPEPAYEAPAPAPAPAPQNIQSDDDIMKAFAVDPLPSPTPAYSGYPPRPVGAAEEAQPAENPYMAAHNPFAQAPYQAPSEPQPSYEHQPVYNAPNHYAPQPGYEAPPVYEQPAPAETPADQWNSVANGLFDPSAQAPYGETARLDNNAYSGETEVLGTPAYGETAELGSNEYYGETEVLSSPGYGETEVLSSPGYGETEVLGGYQPQQAPAYTTYSSNVPPVIEDIAPPVSEEIPPASLQHNVQPAFDDIADYVPETPAAPEGPAEIEDIYVPSENTVYADAPDVVDVQPEELSYAADETYQPEEAYAEEAPAYEEASDEEYEAQSYEEPEYQAEEAPAQTESYQLDDLYQSENPEPDYVEEAPAESEEDNMDKFSNAPQQRPAAPAPAMQQPQIISVPQFAGYDQNGQPVYTYVQMKMTGVDQNGQPVFAPVSGQNIPVPPPQAAPQQRPAAPAPQQQPVQRQAAPQQPQQPAAAPRPGVAPPQRAYVPRKPKMSDPNAPYTTPTANISKIATNPHSKATSQSFVNAIASAKDYSDKSLLDTQGLKANSPILTSVEDVLTQMGDSSVREARAKQAAQPQQNVSGFSEYKGPTNTGRASAGRSSSSMMSSAPVEKDIRFMTKSELKAKKKQDKIDAKFRKDMSKRGF